MFRNSYRLPIKLLGIPIKLNWSFLLILALFTFTVGSQVDVFSRIFNTALGTRIEPAALGNPFVLSFIAVLGLFVGVVLHELGHAVVARRFGVRVKDITLMFLGGVVQFDEMPRQRGAEALVGVAGPITSLLIGLLSFMLIQVTPVAAAGLLFVLSFWTVQNIFLAIFNMLPALPLDGGRVLRSLLALRFPYLKATKIAANVSQVIAVLLGVYGFVTVSFLPMVLAFFIYVAVRGEAQYALVSQLLRDIAVGDLMTREVVTVEPDMGVEQFIKLMFYKRHLSYPVLEDGRLVGYVRMQHAQDAAEGATVADIMNRDLHTIKEDRSALEAFQRITQHDFGRLIVVGPAGNLVGIISKTDLVRAIQERMIDQDVSLGPNLS